MDISINTLEKGLAPAEEQGDSGNSYRKEYTLTVKYQDGSDTEEVAVGVDYYTDESNPTAYSPTEQSEDYWYKSDVILQPPQGYSIADTAKSDTNWGNEITVAGEGEIFKTYYLRNLNTGAIVRGYAKYSIDKTAPTELKADVSVQDTSATVTASAKDTLSDIKSYSLAYNSGGSSAPNIADQGNGKFVITGMETQTDYRFTLTVTDKADNTADIPVAVSTSGKLSLSAAGDCVVGGSSSVSPLMEKLVEAYKEVNPNANIELQTSDSTTGMTSTIEGSYDIGMASRELKEDEAAELTPTVIATDGIAVIVNNNNPTDEMTSDQVKQIYTGEVFSWDEIAE